MIGLIYRALYECCTGLKFKDEGEQRVTLDSVLRDAKQLSKDEFNFVLKQCLKMQPPVAAEYVCCH
jgi:hypothetical protein